MSATRFLRKIVAPTLPSVILHREHLLHTLEEALVSGEEGGMPAPHRLVLLCAPAGYGKTTLLADTVKWLSLTCCWYFLEQSDREPKTFLAVLLASIRQHFPKFGPRLDALLAQAIEQDTTACYLHFLDALIDVLEMDSAERCLLALCNYQEISNNPASNELVNRLLKRLPAHYTLVLESRAMPDLELAPFIANRQIFSISSNALRFSAQDLLDLADLQGMDAFFEEEATQLASTFDGWITGILLGSRFGQAQFEHFTNVSSNWNVAGIYTTHQHLFAFLVKDVFRDDQAIYHFLKSTSLLDQMSPHFCNTLLGISDAHTRLEYARLRGLFVVSTGESGELFYICHPILRTLFREELRSHENERYLALQKQIAMLLHEAHENEAAFSHALEAQDYNLTASIILEAVPALLHKGQNEAVRLWLDRLPVELCQSHPRLLFLYIDAHLRLGDFAAARTLLGTVEALLHGPLLPTGESEERTLILAELNIAHGKVLASQGEHQLAQQHFQQTLEILPENERTLRAQAYQQLGVCILLRGEPVREAIVQFQHALQLGHANTDEILTGELHHQLAIAYGWAGNFAIAEHHRRRVITIQERLGQPRRIINNLTSMGFLKLYQGFEEEAEVLFKKALAAARDTPPLPSTEAYALLALGELEVHRGLFVEALMYLEDSLALAHKLEDRYLLNCTLSMLVVVYLRMDDIDTADCLIEQIALNVNETHSYEGFLYMLVKGNLFLKQGLYTEAQATFEQVVHLTRHAGMQRLLLKALVGQAACSLKQGQSMQTISLLRAILVLNKKGDHSYTQQVEIQAYPDLLPLLQEAIEQEEAPAAVATDQQPEASSTSTPSTSPENLGIKVLPTARLSIFALGEPTVLIDHAPIMRWRMARAMELFFFLLENNQPLRKDQIITTLWQDAEDIERINQTFRSTVYYLRQVIGEGCVVQHGGIYRLESNSVYGQFWYDVAVFEEHHRIAKLALEDKEDERAAEALQKMVDLYRGDYLQSFYSDWCTWRRDELRKAFMEARRQLAFIAWRQEAWDESLAQWQHLLALDPCIEEVHYGIMRCYLRLGKRDLALRQYQRCSQVLQEQLNVKPGPLLQKLHQRIIKQ